MCGLLSEAGCPASPIRAPRSYERRIGWGFASFRWSAVCTVARADGFRLERPAIRVPWLSAGGAKARMKKRGELERESDRIDLARFHRRKKKTPYRNETMFDAVIACCQHDTLLCIATDLTLPYRVDNHAAVFRLEKKDAQPQSRPSVFLLYAKKACTGCSIDGRQRYLGAAQRIVSGRDSGSAHERLGHVCAKNAAPRARRCFRVA